MKQIVFKTELMDLVLRGVKTTTLRRNHSLKEGDIVELVNNSRKIQARITSISVLLLKNVTDSIIKSEGFNTKKELLDIIEKIYGKGITGMFLIKFITIQNSPIVNRVITTKSLF